MWHLRAGDDMPGPTSRAMSGTEAGVSFQAHGVLADVYYPAVDRYLRPVPLRERR